MKIWANENAEKVVFSAILNINIKFLNYSGNVYYVDVKMNAVINT